MTEPDDDDRLLDAFLDRRSPLASAWRDEAAAGQGAPAALDAAILAAAAPEAVTPPRRLTRLRRWPACRSSSATPSCCTRKAA